MALVIRACERILSLDAVVRTAASQAMGMSAPSPLPEVIEGDIAAAYELFFPGKAPSEEVVRELKTLSHEAQGDGDSLEGWRFLFLSLCICPSWQVP